MKFLARLFFRITMLPMVRLLYRVRVLGAERVPESGGVLLLSNHVSYIDSFIMYFASPRPVRFVVLDHYVKIPAIGWFLKLFGAIPIRQGSAKDAIQKSVEALRQGDVVCLFPEGELTRTGVLGNLRKGFELIARKADCPVVPVCMDGLWRSIFSYERERYMKKWPRGLTCPLQVAFGEAIPAREAGRDLVRDRILELSATAFAVRRDFDRTLESAAVKTLKRSRRKPFTLEIGSRAPKAWRRSEFLGMATATARLWMNQPPGSAGDNGRVGLLLPPGPVPAVLNLGLFLAGKVPVNLPFDAVEEAVSEASSPAEGATDSLRLPPSLDSLADTVRDLGLETIVTSRAFLRLLEGFWGKGNPDAPDPRGTFLDLGAALPPSNSLLLAFERVRALIEPAWLTCWRLDLGKRDPGREAVGLVERAGAEPVFLSSRELHENGLQVTAAHFVQSDERLFTELPLSRGAGLVLGLWAPLLSRGRVFARSYSKRQDESLLAGILSEEEAGLVVGTADFFQSLNEPLEAESLRYGVVFPEESLVENGAGDPDSGGIAGLAEVEESLGPPLAPACDFRGRVLAMSRTDPNEGLPGHHRRQSGRRDGSPGRLLPGFAARVVKGVLELRFPGAEGEWIPVGPGGMDEEGFLLLGSPEAEEG